MKTFFVLVAAMVLSGCGGGGGGNGDGSPNQGLNHNQLAEAFVKELNATGSYDVTLAKGSTIENNFIVVHDNDTGEFTAINISGYLSGSDPVAFLNSASVYNDLDLVPGYWAWTFTQQYDIICECWENKPYEYYVETSYHAPGTGLYFEKIQGASKDLETLGALAEETVVENRAEAVAGRFGLSTLRSKEVVRLAMAWKRAGGKDLSEADQDSFSKEVLGFSITEAKSAAGEVVAGDVTALDSLVEAAAKTNDTTPENVRQIIDEYFFPSNP